MKRKTLLIIILTFTIFCFIVFLKGLSTSNVYIPKQAIDIKLLSFNTKQLFNENKISSNDLFIDDKIYILNIWSSWCLPCRTEHSILMKLSKNPLINIIGLNYKDNEKNAKKYINQFGNPYKVILTDKDGTISIFLGAYGVPETLVIKNKKILKKYVGPLSHNSIEEIIFY
jgi:periplasmic protein thiol:disulfide oxidoreductases, DsbE subfamily